MGQTGECLGRRPPGRFNVVLVTACANGQKPKPGASFFPLTVDYREYTYAAGRYPGGFIKREGRPSEKEVLTCRMIDRPIRPLFPEGYRRNETQIIALVVSADPVYDPAPSPCPAPPPPWPSPIFPSPTFWPAPASPCSTAS
jgi:hypothetical protein